MQLGSWGRGEEELEVPWCYFRKGGVDHDFEKECTSENKYIDERAWRLKLSLYTVSAFSFPNEWQIACFKERERGEGETWAGKSDELPFALNVTCHTNNDLHMEMGLPGGSVVKNLSVKQDMQEMWVRSLGWEDIWRRKWQPTLVFLPGKCHGQRSLAVYSSLGRKELDMTESTKQQTTIHENKGNNRLYATDKVMKAIWKTKFIFIQKLV